VFGKEPFIRYRRDTLEDGLQHFPVYGHADARRALEAFEEQLTQCEYAAEFFMPGDSLILLDNHHALHARTSFQDRARHLLRIRLRSASSSMPACDFLTRYTRVKSSAPV
jgi:alpha-ketoglutarate-dependent taurine dioxygenase